MAGKTQSFSFPNASVERLWRASVQAVGVLGYNVLHSDQRSGQISFNTGRSMWSWAGQDLTATIMAAGRGSKLVVGGSLAKGGNPFGGGSQVGAWGEKSRLIGDFADKVTELVPKIAESKKVTNKKCPDCAESVLADAKVCKHCSFRFPTANVKCHKCQHVQGILATQVTFICEGCGAKLQRKAPTPGAQ